MDDSLDLGTSTAAGFEPTWQYVRECDIENEKAAMMILC